LLALIGSIEPCLLLQCFPLKKDNWETLFRRDKDKIRSQKNNNKNKGSFVIRGLSRERERQIGLWDVHGV
jgi:hypothetical protein